MNTTTNTTGEAMNTFDINTFDIVPICRGHWYERMTLGSYMERTFLDIYETKMIQDLGLTAGDYLWAFVYEDEDGKQHLNGLTFKSPTLEGDMDY